MPLLDLFWTMFMFFIFMLWIYLVISVVIDIFRSDDLGGWAKALWVLFIILIPFLGVLVYVIARGQSMQERSMAQAKKMQEQQQEYIQKVAGGSAASPADEVAKLAQLHKQGVLTDAEFQAQKAKILA